MTGEHDQALARAVSDGGDCLVTADEPLAGLQRACGGDVPGAIAIPELRELVRKARAYQLRLARNFSAQDGAHAIQAWAEIEPRDDGEDGCRIVLRNWRTTPIPSEDPAAALARHAEIDVTLAELTARLDARQHLLAVEGDAPDVLKAVAAMRAGLGRPWTDFVAIEGSEHAQPLHWRLLDGARLRLDGSERVWRATFAPQQVPGAEPHGFELYLTSRQAPPASTPADPGDARAQPGMIGRDVAPVLRQPIARIIANAETIRTRLAGPLDDVYANYAADIASAGQLLLGLLDDLSDLEVVEAEDFSTAPDRIDLADVARQAAGILGVRARDRGIRIEAPKLGESLPAVAEFRRVLQVLLNLIGNAIHYSPAHSGITVSLAGDGARARVTVADEGPGLSAEDQARVFEKFERLGRSGDGGSGLGLYISRRLARAMGGELSVESVPGEGARFILELPGADAARE